MRVNGTPLARADERYLTGSLVYESLVFLASAFSYDVIGIENIQTSGPAIYIANHLGTIGPIQAIISIPIRFYPWVIAEMTDFKRAPKYLFDDFVHPVLHLNGHVGMLFSTLLTKISVRLIRSIGAVSIDRFSGWTADGFRHSLRLLREGKNLLIFPEDPLLPLDSDTLMRHFMPGFVTLCNMFQREEGTLPIYPTAVYAGCKTISIGKPEYYCPNSQHRVAINTFCQLVEDRVGELYMNLKKISDEIIE